MQFQSANPKLGGLSSGMMSRDAAQEHRNLVTRSCLDGFQSRRKS